MSNRIDKLRQQSLKMDWMKKKDWINEPLQKYVGQPCNIAELERKFMPSRVTKTYIPTANTARFSEDILDIMCLVDDNNIIRKIEYIP